MRFVSGSCQRPPLPPLVSVCILPSAMLPTLARGYAVVIVLALSRAGQVDAQSLATPGFEDGTGQAIGWSLYAAFQSVPPC